MPKTITLTVLLKDDASSAHLTEALGETMRYLEQIEDGYAGAEPQTTGLVPDPDDPGRYSWYFEGHE